MSNELDSLNEISSCEICVIAVVCSLYISTSAFTEAFLSKLQRWTSHLFNELSKGYSVQTSVICRTTLRNPAVILSYVDYGSVPLIQKMATLD